MTELLINRVKRMDFLIEGILEYSRIGRLAENSDIIDLTTLVHELIEMLPLPESIRIVVPPELPMITGNRVRISQIFQNLVDNAVKFMDKAEGEIRLSVQDNATHWTFCVADNGPGIDQKYHEKIFQMFQTLNRRDTLESTGIGLSIVKKIVESYGGTIWIESVVGQGSRFYFTVPKNP
jgi:signal transduction histidine kinase